MSERTLTPPWAERKQRRRREMVDSLARMHRLLDTFDAWETKLGVDLSAQRQELIDEGIRPMEAMLATLDEAVHFYAKLEAGECCNN